MSAEKVRTITSLLELEGYEQEARKRGFEPEELRALHEMRRKLTPKKRRAKK